MSEGFFALHYAAVTSTMDVARACVTRDAGRYGSAIVLSPTEGQLKGVSLPEGFAAPAIISAAQQSAGRGQQGRPWLSPRGNVYLTLVISLGWVSARVMLPYIMALAVRAALKDVLPVGCEVTLKWPNDILLASKKVAGVLIEQEGEYFLIGCGVNLRHCPDEAQLSYPATALRHHSDEALVSKDIIYRILEHLRSYRLWDYQQVATSYAQYLDPNFLCVYDPTAGEASKIVGIARDGAVLLQRARDGKLWRHYANDMSFGSQQALAP